MGRAGAGVVVHSDSGRGQGGQAGDSAGWVGIRRLARDVEFIELGPRWLALWVSGRVYTLKGWEARERAERADAAQCLRVAIASDAKDIRDLFGGRQQPVGDRLG